MLTLAIECATKTIGLALLEEEVIRAELYFRSARHHTEVLLSAVEQMFILTGETLERVDLLACTTGPGSFTGLRIGVSTVKGLALAMSKPVVGVSTLEALAMNAVPATGLICPLIDAGNGQVYTALFRIGPDGVPQAVTPEKLTDIACFLQDLDREGIVFVGDGAVRYAKLIGETRPGILCDGDRQRLLGSAVGRIGLCRYRSGGALDTGGFTPKYLRLSEAEIHRPGAD
jgi:tRNA threonylcarbamoyladenosine biosynthesis protein TsaB